MVRYTFLDKRVKRLQNSILYSIENFRKGNDHSGLDYLINSLEDLETILDDPSSVEDSKIKIGELIPAYIELWKCMKNTDIIGLTDMLEFKIYPLIKDGVGGSEHDNIR